MYFIYPVIYEFCQFCKLLSPDSNYMMFTLYMYTYVNVYDPRSHVLDGPIIKYRVRVAINL